MHVELIARVHQERVGVRGVRGQVSQLRAGWAGRDAVGLDEREVGRLGAVWVAVVERLRALQVVDVQRGAPVRGESYNLPTWLGFQPLQIVGVTFGDGSRAQSWAAVSNLGGKAEVNRYCGSANYGTPFCTYP